LVTCAFLAGFGCAPKQRVPLDVSPATAAIYLDGVLLDEIPPELKLRSDRDHKLFFKSQGHRSELVVLRSLEQDGKQTLEPAGVQLRLAPLDPTRRELSISGAMDPQKQVGAGRANDRNE
jgi:hypothetical protein